MSMIKKSTVQLKLISLLYDEKRQHFPKLIEEMMSF